MTATKGLTLMRQRGFVSCSWGKTTFEMRGTLVWLLSFHRFSESIPSICRVCVLHMSQCLSSDFLKKINESYITFPQKNAPSNISHGIFWVLGHFLSWSIWKTLSAGSEEIIFLFMTHTYPVSQTILPTPTAPDFLRRNFSWPCRTCFNISIGKPCANAF